jgi:hypothetical protein
MQTTGVQLENIAVNIDQQSTLARLLAKENISVIHGSYKTAWFDPKRRVLALPVWKNRGKAVYDLLTGHEVGHALYTPAIGWHDAVDDVYGAPKAYLNVLEDVRIERKIQDQYPGLRSQFQKAYKVLAADDFFGITDVDVNTIRLIDKINLKSKLGPNVEVEFDPTERVFFNASFKTETFDEVVALAKEIYAYHKSLQEAMEEQHVPSITLPDFDELDLDDDMGNDSANDYDKPEVQDAPPPVEESEQEKGGEEPPKPQDGKTGHGSDGIREELHKDDVKEGPSEKASQDEQLVDAEAMTDKAFREREQDLVATEELKDTMVYTMNKVRQPGIVIDYKEYYAEWNRELEERYAREEGYYRQMIEDQLANLKDKFNKFRNETDMAAAYMAKEFELRKAAYQYSRSSLQKTGVINTNKLHAYKYSEDIFLKSTKLANYKNHGMMMFIDFSGSMSENMGATIRQLLNLTTFCRMINVPYEVYAFTTRVREEKEETDVQWDDFADCEIIPEKFNLLNLMSSRMTRKEYTEGFRMLWNLSMAWDSQLTQMYINRWNHLHSTPLNTTIVYANEMIKDYKKKHNIEKMTAMFLTDGESDSFQIRMTEEGAEKRIPSPGSFYGYRGRKAIVRVDGQSMKVASVNSSDMTAQLLKFLKKSTDSNVLGFFISQYRNQAINKAVSEAPHTSISKYRDKYTQQMTKNRCLIEDNIFGYDRYFGLCTKYMDITENEFGELVEDGATKNKIKTAFAKASKSKRVNRILLNAFVDAIA